MKRLDSPNIGAELDRKSLNLSFRNILLIITMLIRYRSATRKQISKALGELLPDDGDLRERLMMAAPFEQPFHHRGGQPLPMRSQVPPTELRSKGRSRYIKRA